MNILIPQGIGDAIWSLMKIQSVADRLGGGVIDCYIQNHHGTPSERRALDFVSRFGFVRSVSMYATSILKPGPEADGRGIPNYIDSGPSRLPGIDYVLVANRHLDTGNRLEEWMPEFETRWDAIDDFQFKLSELRQADRVKKDCGDYAVFFMAHERGNREEGHNRDGLWSPREWAELGNWCVREKGLSVVVVGGADDVSYFENYVRPLITENESRWVNLIGKLEIGATFAVTRQARFVISYQSGIGIVSQYMGVPGGVFWRPYGDSLSPTALRTSENAMVSAWANPRYMAEGKHLPLFYGTHGVEYVKSEIVNRGW